MNIPCFVLCQAWLVAVPVAGEPEVPPGPGLGQPTEARTGPDWVFPDGTGLPAGSGDALRGVKVYQQHCISCHGPQGEGGSAEPLAGGQGSLAGPHPVQTVGSYWPHAVTLFDFNQRAMPPSAPGSLSHDDNYAVTAYILYLNGLVGESDVMNAGTLPEVVMPNRDGFRPAGPLP